MHQISDTHGHTAARPPASHLRLARLRRLGVSGSAASAIAALAWGETRETLSWPLAAAVAPVREVAR